MPRVQPIDIKVINEYVAERRAVAERIERERQHKLELLERIAVAVEKIADMYLYGKDR